MFDENIKLGHFPFFEEIASREEGTKEWHAATAGLVHESAEVVLHSQGHGLYAPLARCLIEVYAPGLAATGPRVDEKHRSRRRTDSLPAALRRRPHRRSHRSRAAVSIERP